MPSFENHPSKALEAIAEIEIKDRFHVQPEHSLDLIDCSTKDTILKHSNGMATIRRWFIRMKSIFVRV